VLATVRLSRADTSDDFKQLIEGRINALAQVHGLFVQSRWTGAELHNLVTQELSPYCDETEWRVRIDGPPVILEPNTAQTIAISLHELATNAAKYGSLSAADGRVEIAWSRTADGRLSLRWIESGGPTVTPPTHRGFGTRVMENIIAGQLRGCVLIGPTKGSHVKSSCRFYRPGDGGSKVVRIASIGGASKFTKRVDRLACGNPRLTLLLKFPGGRMSRMTVLVLAVLGSLYLPGQAFAQLTPPAGSAGAGNSPISGVPFGPANPRVLSDPSGIGNASNLPPLRSNPPYP
jgi:two-component sensor histidine kinase